MTIIVGKVYANWCGHCQSLKPEWKRLKNIINSKNVQFIEIEESEKNKRQNFENKTKLALNVNGYPTIFKIDANKHIEYYSGVRSAKDMKKWILKNSKKTRQNKRKKNRYTQRNIKNWMQY